MSTIGAGVREIRVRDESGIFRVIYVTKIADRIFVLHCFQKKTQKTAIAYPFSDSAVQGFVEGVFAMKETFESVWDAIEDDPMEREKLKLQSRLMHALRDYIETEGLTKKEAVKKLGVTQARISDLSRGKIDLFAIDSLVDMAVHAGLRVEMHIGKAA